MIRIEREEIIYCGEIIENIRAYEVNEKSFLCAYSQVKQLLRNEGLVPKFTKSVLNKDENNYALSVTCYTSGINRPFHLEISVFPEKDKEDKPFFHVKCTVEVELDEKEELKNALYEFAGKILEIVKNCCETEKWKKVKKDELYELCKDDFEFLRRIL